MRRRSTLRLATRRKPSSSSFKMTANGSVLMLDSISNRGRGENRDRLRISELLYHVVVPRPECSPTASFGGVIIPNIVELDAKANLGLAERPPRTKPPQGVFDF